MSALDHVVPEFERCDLLRQIDLDRFKASGIPTMALVEGKLGLGRCLKKARVVLDSSGRRFEFERFSRFHTDADAAFIVLALDRDGEPADLVAWRAEPSGFLALWLGQVGLLGEENLDGARFGEPLTVHPDPMSWLRCGREGVVVVDAIRAGPLLRQTGEMVVDSHRERNRLNAIMRVDLPKIIVRSHIRVVAAE